MAVLILASPSRTAAALRDQGPLSNGTAAAASLPKRYVYVRDTLGDSRRAPVRAARHRAAQFITNPLRGNRRGGAGGRFDHARRSPSPSRRYGAPWRRSVRSTVVAR